MTEREIDARAMLVEAWRLMRETPALVALYFIVLVVIGSVADLQILGVDESLAYLTYSVVSTALGYGLTVQMLRKGGLAPDGLRRGFWTYIGMNFLAVIGTALGLLLLVVPGLLLFVRWLPSYGFALSDGLGVANGFGASWDATGKHLKPVTIVALIPVMLICGAFAVSAAEEIGWSIPDAFVVVAFVVVALNILVVAATLGTIAIGLGCYAVLRDPGRRVADVFD